MRIFIDNLSFQATEGEISDAFAEYGDVSAVEIVTSRIGRPLGRAYVEMGSRSSAQCALRNLDGLSIRGRRIHLSERSLGVGRFTH